MNKVMKKIIDYQVIESQINSRIVILVHNELKNGWQPYGQMIITPSGKYVQPMVKYEEIVDNDLLIAEITVSNWLKKYGIIKEKTVIDPDKVIVSKPKMISEDGKD